VTPTPEGWFWQWLQTRVNRGKDVTLAVVFALTAAFSNAST